MSVVFPESLLFSLEISQPLNKIYIWQKNSKPSVVRLRPLAAAAAASSSSSAGGYPIDYPEKFLDVQKKQRRRKIAGVDQDELQDPALLADPDSCFCEFQGVQLHHKICDSGSQTHDPLQSHTVSQLPHRPRKLGFPLILLHGFGASVFSWDRVMKRLADVTGSKVLAFDRPAFGLTSRVDFSEYSDPSSDDTKPLNPYSTAFSVLATLYFIDSLAAEKVVLVGHSAGSIIAVNSYFEAPERVAAMILVAPAILAPFSTRNVERNRHGREKQIQGDSLNSNSRLNPFIGFCKRLLKFFKYIFESMMRLVQGMKNMLKSLSKKALSAVLRSALAVMLVRVVIDKFGVAAVRHSWYDSSKVTDHVIHGYTKPLRSKNWDRALVEYTTALLTDSVSETQPPLAKRLSEISCPVLVITGDSDRLVPPWNTERLSRAIPGACLEVIKKCGHLPHEEKVEEFVEVVQKFLHRVFGNSEEQHLRTAT